MIILVVPVSNRVGTVLHVLHQAIDIIHKEAAFVDNTTFKYMGIRNVFHVNGHAKLAIGLIVAPLVHQTLIEKKTPQDIMILFVIA